MKEAVLVRQDESDEGTFGTLKVYEGGTLLYTCFTGELPNRDNQPRVSCIPKGWYGCQPWHSRKYPRNYNVMEVPGRSAILIHAGNFCGDRSKGYRTNVEGCILVGRSLGTIQGQKAVLSSRLAMNDLWELIGESQFSIRIKESL